MNVCGWCDAVGRALVAVLGSDPSTHVCAACHARLDIPTISLAALKDSRPAYVVTYADLALMAWRDVTPEEAAAIVKGIENSDAGSSIEDAVYAVCGNPPGIDSEEDR